MSYVATTPELVAAAATDLATIGATIGAANAVAATPTTSVLPAGADDVSTSVAALLGGHAQAYQAYGAQMGTFHSEFVQSLNVGANGYATAEAANASQLQAVRQGMPNLIGSPVKVLFGDPLTGTGDNRVPATGAIGRPGGSLLGDGGTGNAGLSGSAGIARSGVFTAATGARISGGYRGAGGHTGMFPGFGGGGGTGGNRGSGDSGALIFRTGTTGRRAIPGY